MIKKSVFENDLIAGMEQALVKNAANQDTDNLESAVDYLNSAIDIFEEAGMTASADKVLNILSKLANDRHTKGLTSEKMVKNLENHGLMTNLSDDGAADDLLNIDIEDPSDAVDLEVSDKLFEDSD